MLQFLPEHLQNLSFSSLHFAEPPKEALFREWQQWSATWVLESGSCRFASGLFCSGTSRVQDLVFLGLSVSSVTWDHKTSLPAACKSVTPAVP